MKKKELINKINSLIDSLNSMDKELKNCLKENDELKSQVEELLKKKETPAFVEIKQPQVEILLEKEPENNQVINEEPLKEETQTVQTDETDKIELVVLPIGEKVVLPDSVMEFGSEIIGKIVIESANYADVVTASASKDKKELLNLIMGKSEVCKAEILNVVTGNASTEVKISLINAQLSEAVDYFKSVVAQI